MYIDEDKSFYFECNSLSNYLFGTAAYRIEKSFYENKLQKSFEVSIKAVWRSMGWTDTDEGYLKTLEFIEEHKDNENFHMFDEIYKFRINKKKLSIMFYPDYEYLIAKEEKQKRIR